MSAIEEFRSLLKDLRIGQEAFWSREFESKSEINIFSASLYNCFLDSVVSEAHEICLKILDHIKDRSKKLDTDELVKQSLPLMNNISRLNVLGSFIAINFDRQLLEESYERAVYVNVTVDRIAELTNLHPFLLREAEYFKPLEQ